MKEGIQLANDFEPYVRDGEIVWRKRHDNISPAHRKFDECMKNGMEGRRFGSLAESESHFAELSRKCHKTDPY